MTFNRWKFAVLSGALTLTGGVAHAQTAASGFALNRYDPSERGSEWFQLDSLDFRGELRPAAGLTFDYGYKPLVAYDKSGNELAAIVKNQLFAHVGGSLVLFDRFRLGLNVPVALFQSGSDVTVNSLKYTAASGAALGDIRVGGDVRIVGQHDEAFTLAAGAQVFIPSGNQANYAGDGKIRLQPHAMAAGRIDMFVYSARAAFTYRGQDAKVDSSDFGSELNFGAAAGVKVLDDALVVGPEVYGGTVLADAFARRTTPFEAILGAHYQAGDFQFGAGVGPGLTRGFGTPKVRVLGSAEWAPAFAKAVIDTDMDGIPDDVDACKEVKGVASLDPAKNGCPADGDGDGILDEVDACPTVKGVPSDDPKKHGCPPAKDTDGDGITDDVDACKTVKGVKSTDPKKNGCPADTDGDGITDDVDACKTVKGVANDDPKKHGCPADRDGDGIEDGVDACIDVPGVANADPKKNGCPSDRDDDGVPDQSDNCPDEKGVKENQGCPAKKKQLVVITKEKLEIKEQVFFDTGKATIQKKSFGLLDQVAAVVVGHPEIEKIVVEGHTDNVGKPDKNKKLSQDRADSVKKYLTGKGVAASKLDAAGFGQERPIDDNKTPAGRANNRRVEFKLPKAVETSSTKTVESP